MNSWKPDYERVMECPSIRPEYKRIIQAYVEELDAKLFGAKDEQRFHENITAQVNFLNRERGERIKELEAKVAELESHIEDLGYSFREMDERRDD